MNYIQPNLGNLNLSAQTVESFAPKTQENEKRGDALSFSDALNAAYKESKELKKDEPRQKTSDSPKETEHNEKNGILENSSAKTVSDAESKKSAKSDEADSSKKNGREEKTARADSSKNQKSDERISRETEENAQDFEADSENALAMLSLSLEGEADFSEQDFDVSEIENENALSSLNVDEENVRASFVSQFEETSEEKSKNSRLGADFENQKNAEAVSFYENENLQGEAPSSLISENAERKIAATMKNQNGVETVADGGDFSFSESSEEAAEEKIRASVSRLAVHDLRSEKGREKSASSKKADLSREKGAARFKPQFSKQTAQTNARVAYQGEAEKAEGQQLTIELAARTGIEQNITSSSQQVASANGSDFQQMLSNVVQQNAQEFVKAGNIVLKDGNSGTINLILRPESLGNVKISLSLSDKIVSGQITVASKEAFDAFRESIDAIRQAFTESGFDTGAFDLNFSNSGQEFAQGNEERGFNEQERFANAEKKYGDYAALDSLSSDSGSASNVDAHSVSIVA